MRKQIAAVPTPDISPCDRLSGFVIGRETSRGIIKGVDKSQYSEEWQQGFEEGFDAQEKYNHSVL